MNNVVLNFLQESLQRLFIKMPFFFKVWAFISGAFVLITGLPDFINMLPAGITIPDLWNEKITLIVAWVSRGMLLMAFFTTQSKPIAVTTTGEVIKKTDENKLPFTVADEKQFASKESVPVVKIKPADDIKSINN